MELHIIEEAEKIKVVLLNSDMTLVKPVYDFLKFANLQSYLEIQKQIIEKAA